MKTSISKTKVLLSLLLFATIAFPLLSIPAADAHTPAWTIPRYAFATAAPQPAGVGQTIAIVVWTDVPPPSAAAKTGDRWTGYTVDVTRPDGTVDHPMVNGVSDPVGSTYCLYTPTAAGTYTITFSFPQQVAQLVGYTGIPGGTTSPYINDTFLGASTTQTFTVQQTPYPYFVEAQLPVSYWTRPINENDQTWSSIASAWLGQRQFGATYDKFNPQGWAPNTAHVSMLYPLSWGGIVGDDQNAIVNGMSFYSGTQYNLKFSNPIIMYGNVYFSIPQTPGISGYGIACVDLRTGQTKWTRPDINSVSFGQMYDGETPNQHGVSGEYLWYSGTVPAGKSITGPTPNETAILSGPFTPTNAFATQQILYGSGFFAAPSITSTTTAAASAWCAIDPLTGNNQFNETNVPVGSISSGLAGNLVSGGIQAQGPNGEWLIYNIGTSGGTAPYTYLTQWNNTKTPGIDVANGITAWGPGANNYNMSAAYDWNYTLDQGLYRTQSTIGASPINNYNPTILYVLPGDLIFGQSSGLQTIPGTSAGIFGTQDPYTLWAINLNATRGQIGHVLFQTAYPAPAGNLTVQIGPIDQQNNVFTIYYRETLQWSGYSALTGQLLWGPLASQNQWNYYSGTTGLTNPIGVGYGHLYTAGYGGELYAINTLNGNIDFTFGESTTDPNNSTLTAETVYGHYPTMVAAIANNKVYLVEEEHSLNAPAYHGAKTRCVDAITGKLLWDIYGISSWQEQAVADGYYTWLNLNDMQVYAMGPGPSATTVTAPATAVSLGQSLEITGTVTDQTPQKQLFGTPAVSDQDQGKEMEYLIQHSIDRPANITGVPVQLYATDSSGTTSQIASIMSTGTGGIFHYLWTPPATGEYVITANFAGTASYGPSSAQTAVGVVSAPSAVVATPTPPPTSVVTPIPPTPTPPPTPIVTAPSVAPSPPATFPATEVYVIAAAIIIIVIVAVAAIALRRRK